MQQFAVGDAYSDRACVVVDVGHWGIWHEKLVPVLAMTVLIGDSLGRLQVNAVESNAK